MSPIKSILAITDGRFMSPDWSATPAAIPYANPGNPQSLNLYSYVLDNPVSTTDPDGHSHLIYDGKSHQVYLIAHGGAVIGHWTAYNRVAIHFDHKKNITAGPLPNGKYGVLKVDQHGATMHLGNNLNGPFGPGGIIHFENHLGFNGKKARGVGLHGGQANSSGPKHPTYGCVRTCNPGMQLIDQWLHNNQADPLHYILVKNNQTDINTWLKNKHKYCDINKNKHAMGCSQK